MMIYKKYKLIYTGTEKCAQTSLYHHFGNTWSSAGVLGPPIQDNAKKFSKLRPKYPDYKLITFVRNPYDRILSCFYYYLQHASKGKPSLRENYSFKNWVDDTIHGTQTPFGTWVNPISDKIDIEPDFLGRYENINADVKKIHDMAGIEFKGLAWKNRSSTRKKRGKNSHREMYDDKMREFVKNYYKEDLERFGYTF